MINSLDTQDSFPYPQPTQKQLLINRRTKYACFKLCRKEEQTILPCNYDKEQCKYGYTCHAIGHNIVFTQDIIFDYLTIGKKSPVLKLNY